MKNEKYISVYECLIGWKPVMIWWNDEEKDLGGFWEPYQTGQFAYEKKDEAIQDAKSWAEAEGLEYKEH